MNKKFSILLILIIFLFFSCTTQKNTPVTRTYHNITAHYNVYFNGNESYKAGELKIDREYKENYSILLPIYKHSDDEAVKLTSSDMERTLSKMGKTIAVHSITVKPKIKGDLTPKDKEFLKRTEYCKWIDEAYLFIGKADFYKRDYSKALRSFRKIITEYKYEDSRFEAQLWIAKIYIEQEKYKDAYNYLTELENDVRHPKNLDKDINLVFADYYIRQKDYANTISRLTSGIELTKNKDEKARFYFILAQLEHLSGNNEQAAKNLKKVIKINPNYDMVFTAKIMSATVFTKGQNSAEIKKKLSKMLKDDKNEEYKDQIYYALAIIEQKEENEPKAIEYFKLSASTSVSNNNQKAVSFLALADIFFAKKDFLQAGQYYDSTMQYLSTNYPEYNQISKKAENTGMLVEYLSVVETQDSLQRIANMPENDRNAFINNLIQDYIEEEQKRQNDMNNQYDYDPYFDNNQNNQNDNQGGKWYMYNPVLISRGQNEFKKKWGNRKLEDHWRRKNKTLISDFGDQNETPTEDSTRIVDKKNPEYYLQDLPLTDSAMEVSNNLIIDALFNAGDVYEHRLNDNSAAIRTYEELMRRFPDNYLKLETYYRLYKLYVLENDTYKADYYKQLIIIQYPDSKYAKIILDPNFVDKLIKTEQQALNLFDKTLISYNKNQYENTINLANEGLSKYPDSQTFPSFLFLKAKAYGNLGYDDSLVFYLDLIVKKFQKTEIADLSQDILYLIESGKYNFDIYDVAPESKHFYIVLIDKKTDTEGLRFKLRLNAEKFSNTKTFEIKEEAYTNDYKLITLQYFDNQSQAIEFYKTIPTSTVFDGLQEDKYKTFIITDSNYTLFTNDKMIEKYELFFNKNYSPAIR